MILGRYRQWAMGPCFFCGVQTYRLAPTSLHPQKYTRDHLVPKRLRGKIVGDVVGRCHDLTVTCCLRCNGMKGHMSPESFLRRNGVLTREKIRAINRAFNLYRRA